MTNPVSPGNFIHWREMNHSFTDLPAASSSFNFTLTGAGDPVEVPGQLVSGQFFSVLGVKPLLGRLLTTDDDRPNNHVAVISDRLWARRFNRDPRVLEGPVDFAGDPFTIVGILPADFTTPRSRKADGRGREPAGAGHVPASSWWKSSWRPEVSRFRQHSQSRGASPSQRFGEARRSLRRRRPTPAATRRFANARAWLATTAHFQHGSV